MTAPGDTPLTESLREQLEPLDDWVHVQPSMDEERKGRIYLPAEVGGGRIQRSMVLASGAKVDDLHPGDVVLVLTSHVIDMRDGSRLVQRQHVVARLNG